MSGRLKEKLRNAINQFPVWDIEIDTNKNSEFDTRRASDFFIFDNFQTVHKSVEKEISEVSDSSLDSYGSEYKSPDLNLQSTLKKENLNSEDLKASNPQILNFPSNLEYSVDEIEHNTDVLEIVLENKEKLQVLEKDFDDGEIINYEKIEEIEEINTENKELDRELSIFIEKNLEKSNLNPFVTINENTEDETRSQKLDSKEIKEDESNILDDLKLDYSDQMLIVEDKETESEKRNLEEEEVLYHLTSTYSKTQNEVIEASENQISINLEDLIKTKVQSEFLNKTENQVPKNLKNSVEKDDIKQSEEKLSENENTLNKSSIRDEILQSTEKEELDKSKKKKNYKNLEILIYSEDSASDIEETQRLPSYEKETPKDLCIEEKKDNLEEFKETSSEDLGAISAIYIENNQIAIEEINTKNLEENLVASNTVPTETKSERTEELKQSSLIYNKAYESNLEDLGEGKSDKFEIDKKPSTKISKEKDEEESFHQPLLTRLEISSTDSVKKKNSKPDHVEEIKFKEPLLKKYEVSDFHNSHNQNLSQKNEKPEKENLPKQCCCILL